MISDQCDVWGIYEFYIFQETKKVGQEVAFGQIVQTQRQRKESKRLIVQTQKERKLCLEKYGDFIGNNEIEDLAGRPLWRRWAQLYF